MNIIELNETNRTSVDQYIKDEWGGPGIGSMLLRQVIDTAVSTYK